MSKTVFGIYIVEIGLAVLALFYSIFGLREDKATHYSVSADLSGNWRYQSEKANGTRKYQGECTIRQNERSLNISGHLEKVQHIEEKEISREEDVNIYWETQWAYLCEDSKLRFDFSSALPEGPIRGYCVMNIGKNSTKNLMESVIFCHQILVYRVNFGNITFERM